MKSYTTASAILFAMSAPALAADLPARTAPALYVPPPIPVFSWTGFYAGVQGGYTFGKDTTDAVATAGPYGRGGVGVGAIPGSKAFASLSSNPGGVVGGGHVGYNVSTRSLPVLNGLGGIGGGGLVVGIEGDAEGLDNSSTRLATSGFLGTPFSKIKSNLQGSVRGRIGIGFDRLLVYGTGGAAFGDFKSTYGLDALAFQSFDTTRVGYTVGGGVEYALTNTWSVRAEYRYSDYGTFTNTFATNVGQAATIVVRHRETNQRVEGGISYLFTSPVPTAVVAKY